MKPPKLDGNTRLDFSEFHPLIHSLWDCQGYYGGPLHHIRLSWEYMWRPALRAVLCRWPLNCHKWTQGWRRVGEDTYMEMKLCMYCEQERP